MTPQNFCQHPAAKKLPLVAILRGLTPEEAPAIGQALINAGFSMLEVPLNSPRPFESIALLRKLLGKDVLIGAGTVLTVEDVDKTLAAGGDLIVSPNCNTEVIRHASRLEHVAVLPGVMTPTEAFAALEAGASGLKFFPADTLPPAYIKALRAVLPKHVPCFPVGGINADAAQMKTYVQAGANGFGLGSGLYKPGMDATTIAQTAKAYVAAWKEVSAIL